MDGVSKIIDFAEWPFGFLKEILYKIFPPPPQTPPPIWFWISYKKEGRWQKALRMRGWVLGMWGSWFGWCSGLDTWGVRIPGALVQLKRLESERQKFSRAPKCPVPKIKFFMESFSGHLHALPLPYNFFPACFGCKNKVLDGIMCLEIFQNSFWTTFGEPLARFFAKKMVFTPKSYFSTFYQKIEGPFLELVCH